MLWEISRFTLLASTSSPRITQTSNVTSDDLECHQRETVNIFGFWQWYCSSMKSSRCWRAFNELRSSCCSQSLVTLLYFKKFHASRFDFLSTNHSNIKRHFRCICVNCVFFNLVPRVLRLFGQRGGARRDSGIMEFLIPENVGFRSLCACLRLKRKSNAPKWQPRYCYWAWRFYRALKVFEKAKIDSTRDQKELDFFP